jgi:hypothetical protein
MTNIYKIEQQIISEDAGSERLIHWLINQLRPKTNEDMLEYAIWTSFLIVTIVICLLKFDFRKQKTGK